MWGRCLHLPAIVLIAAVTLQAATTCATCHPKIAQTYAQTGMARSFYKPQSIPTTRYYHKLSDTWYAIEDHNGQYYQRRWRIGYDGKETEVQESRIDYVMGSGNHVRTYLTRTPRGALIELPLAWYSENGGTWGMNPGHDRNYALPPRTVATTPIRRFPLATKSPAANRSTPASRPKASAASAATAPAPTIFASRRPPARSPRTSARPSSIPPACPATANSKSVCSAISKPPACNCRTRS